MSLLSYRDWPSLCTSPKDDLEHLAYSKSMWDSAKSGLGCNFNRHLNHSIESISVNVGDSQQNVNERRSSDVCCESRSRHSSRRLGKPATGRRTAEGWKLLIN
jgi:hypothetical protein